VVAYAHTNLRELVFNDCSIPKKPPATRKRRRLSFITHDR
jgi:hypothetical protein